MTRHAELVLRHPREALRDLAQRAREVALRARPDVGRSVHFALDVIRPDDRNSLREA